MGVSHRGSLGWGGVSQAVRTMGSLGNIHPGCHVDGGREGRQDWKRFWVFNFFFLLKWGHGVSVIHPVLIVSSDPPALAS